MLADLVGIGWRREGESSACPLCTPNIVHGLIEVPSTDILVLTDTRTYSNHQWWSDPTNVAEIVVALLVATIIVSTDGNRDQATCILSIYRVFTLRKPRSSLILNGEGGFLRVDRLQSSGNLECYCHILHYLGSTKYESNMGSSWPCV